MTKLRLLYSLANPCYSTIVSLIINIIVVVVSLLRQFVAVLLLFAVKFDTIEQ